MLTPFVKTAPDRLNVAEVIVLGLVQPSGKAEVGGVIFKLANQLIKLGLV